ncbi:hypothetical protein G9F72_004855 [Clostridium estertheticum]|uniref:hypothetical protein n=1 Tax=Clostridium estertheticum TaxID=238834 RepID=UPI0013E966BB|nr:hypothetical protein [Clostridium estertheticum]MBZ9685682.1 hypothetical protein [Clostridium estertheticum]
MKNENKRIYDIFLNYSYSQLKELFKMAKSKEEQDFYIMLSNMLLQREQEKVIVNNYANIHNICRC